MALDQLIRQLVDEAGDDAALAPTAEQAPFPRPRHVETATRPRDADVAEPPLLLLPTLLERPHVGEAALLAADHEDGVVFQALRVVQRHQGDERVLLAQGIL